jgi:hypothetical protein
LLSFYYNIEYTNIHNEQHNCNIYYRVRQKRRTILIQNVEQIYKYLEKFEITPSSIKSGIVTIHNVISGCH